MWRLHGTVRRTCGPLMSPLSVVVSVADCPTDRSMDTTTDWASEIVGVFVKSHGIDVA
jgi:hypothetical protein